MDKRYPISCGHLPYSAYTKENSSNLNYKRYTIKTITWERRGFSHSLLVHVIMESRFICNNILNTYLFLAAGFTSKRLTKKQTLHLFITLKTFMYLRNYKTDHVETLDNLLTNILSGVTILCALLLTEDNLTSQSPVLYWRVVARIGHRSRSSSITNEWYLMSTAPPSGWG